MIQPKIARGLKPRSSCCQCQRVPRSAFRHLLPFRTQHAQDLPWNPLQLALSRLLQSVNTQPSTGKTCKFWCPVPLPLLLLISQLEVWSMFSCGNSFHIRRIDSTNSDLWVFKKTHGRSGVLARGIKSNRKVCSDWACRMFWSPV